MNVSLADPRALHAPLRADLDAAIARVVDSGRFVGGAEVEAFEAELAAATGTACAVGVGSGTDALYLVLRALGVGPGDEVITVPYTFVATASAIAACGARPVFADVEADTGLMDPGAVLAAVTPRTRAILPVHLFGMVADMGALREVARRHGLALVEDAAQAQGARDAAVPGASEASGASAISEASGASAISEASANSDATEAPGARVGALGDAGCFSFYPGKNLGALGDGGAVVTSDAALAARVRRLADHGRVERFRHAEVGLNSRLDALQAAVLRVKLRHLKAWNARRGALAARYSAVLDAARVERPRVRVGTEPAWNLFPVRTADRDRLRAHLADAGVETGLHYPVPLHLQPAFADLGYRAGDLPVTESLCGRSLSLPVHPALTDAQVDVVAARVAAFAADAASG